MFRIFKILFLSVLALTLVSGCVANSGNRNPVSVSSSEMEPIEIHGPSFIVYDRLDGHVIFDTVYEPSYNYTFDEFSFVAAVPAEGNAVDFMAYYFSANDVMIENSVTHEQCIPGEMTSNN